jgi:hypothetical protein
VLDILHRNLHHFPPFAQRIAFSCSGYSQLKKTADKIYAFDDTRAAAVQSKSASAARPLFPDRALPPMTAPPVSLQPPYAVFQSFNAFDLLK